MHTILEDRIIQTDWKSWNSEDSKNIFTCPHYNYVSWTGRDVFDKVYEGGSWLGWQYSERLSRHLEWPDNIPVFSENTDIHYSNTTHREHVYALREHYISRGYYDEITKNIQLPNEGIYPTMSMPIESILWSSKDVRFLEKYYAANPERAHFVASTPGDQKFFRQCLRHGVLIGIDMPSDFDVQHLSILFAEEVLNPFQIGQLLAYNFRKFGLKIVWERWVELRS